MIMTYAFSCSWIGLDDRDVMFFNMEIKSDWPKDFWRGSRIGRISSDLARGSVARVGYHHSGFSAKNLVRPFLAYNKKKSNFLK